MVNAKIAKHLLSNMYLYRRALEKLGKHSALPCAIETLLSCISNFPLASITQKMHSKHGPTSSNTIWEVTAFLVIMENMGKFYNQCYMHAEGGGKERWGSFEFL